MLENELIDEIAKIIGAEANSLTPDADISDQWDSMGQISVLAMLKKKTGVNMSAADLASIKTVHDILSLLKNKGVNIE